MPYRLTDYTDGLMLGRVLGTFPSMDEAKAAIGPTLEKAFGGAAYESVGEDDAANDGYDVFAYVPGTLRSPIVLAIDPA
jgi:streptogramin lyase